MDPGNVVQANGTTPLAVVTQEQPITVIFTVAEDSLGANSAQLHKGAHCLSTPLIAPRKTRSPPANY